MVAEGHPSLLVGDVVVRHPDLSGLDSVVEIFAVDALEGDPAAPVWGCFWSEPLRAAPPLPPACRAELPEEGGFVIRPVSFSSDASSAAAAALLARDAFRRVVAPKRSVHEELGFPEPVLVGNDIFCELRYAMAPSLVRWLEFDDIRDGVIRVFALPHFEGEVRVLTVADEASAREVLSGRVGDKLQRHRLLQFLHAAAAAPAAARWPTTAELAPPPCEESVSQPVDGLPGLFAHQAATVRWMQRVEAAGSREAGGRELVQVAPLDFAGVALGSDYEVVLPHGGVVAHPPGSGKTRIVAKLAAAGPGHAHTGVAEPALDASSTLVICPPHLCAQWREELRCAGALDSSVVAAYDACPVATFVADAAVGARLIVDEPQDCPAGETWQALQALVDAAREARRAVWLLCGTAPSHLETIGRLLLGRRGWHIAHKQSEWRGCPQLSHIVNARFLADPAWACLPLPPLAVADDAVVLRPRESADAAVASLAGFVLDGVMLLSFGADAAFAAAQERDQLLLQMGWTSSMGASLLRPEHALADWDGTVAQRSQLKLDELDREIQELESLEAAEAARFQVAGGDAALAADLSFLARAAVHVRLEGLEEGDAREEACTAEWNALLESRRVSGRLIAGPEGLVNGCVALLPCPEDGDFATAAAIAGVAGAVGVLFEAREAEDVRPFGYRHDQAPPTVPAAMIRRPLGRAARAALGGASHLVAHLEVALQDDDEAEEEADQGLISAFIADDAIKQELHQRLKTLRDERERCRRSLVFAHNMHELLERNEAHCPVCLHGGKDVEAFAVLPECFHVLCRACLETQAAGRAVFGCPMCRSSAAYSDVVLFRAPDMPACEATADGGGENSEEQPPGAVDDAPDSGSSPEGGDDAASEAPVRSPSGPRLGVNGSWEALPSKMQRLVVLLQELLSSGAEERVLVFTQWAAHVAYIHDLLARHGIEALALAGELSETMDALRRFGQPEEPRVLLLSSQRHSSGINLQAARHVVIVHPYCTPTAASQESISRTQMLAYEAQAIGRVRRYPQHRPVHVYRLFAAGTVEEGLYAGR